LRVGVKGDDRQPLTLGDVTSVNFTTVEGGVQLNVVPETMVAGKESWKRSFYFSGFDIRVSPSYDLPKFRQTLERWVSEAGYENRIGFIVSLQLKAANWNGSNTLAPTR
jgi:aminoacylase